MGMLHTAKQVFLRELVFERGGRLEKQKGRLHSVQDEACLGDTKDLEVKVEHDAESKTFSIINTASACPRRT